MPINITYDNSSSLNSVDDLNDFIATTLTQYSRDECIESTLFLMVLENVRANQTEVQCFIKDLGNDSSVIFINTSGMKMILLKKVCFNH